MPRSIRDFNGKAVVIGCSQFHSFCKTKYLHEGEEHFYSIDKDPFQKPDLVFDITHALPKEFKSRFQLTILECLDSKAYNDSPDNFGLMLAGEILLTNVLRRNSGMKGFQNVWDMTSPDGFILIIGCTRDKEFREQLLRRKLKYIELDSSKFCVFIAKNQRLSFTEVQQQMKTIDPVLKKTIEGAEVYFDNQMKTIDPVLKKTIEGTEVYFDSKPNIDIASDFCNLDFDKLYGIACPSVKDLKKISTFMKIYHALQATQDFFSKESAPVFFRLYPYCHTFILEIENYVKTYSDSMTAQAWFLADKYPLDVHSSNKNLLHAIQEYVIRKNQQGVNFSKDDGPNYKEEAPEEKIKNAASPLFFDKIRNVLDKHGMMNDPETFYRLHPSR